MKSLQITLNLNERKRAKILALKFIVSKLDKYYSYFNTFILKDPIFSFSNAIDSFHYNKYALFLNKEFNKRGMIFFHKEASMNFTKRK